MSAVPPPLQPPLTSCMGCGKVLKPEDPHYRHQAQWITEPDGTVHHHEGGGDWCPDCALQKVPGLLSSVMVSALTGNSTRMRVFDGPEADPIPHRIFGYLDDPANHKGPET